MRRSDPKRVGALFDELFNSPHIAAKIAEGCLPETWREVVGDAIADQTSQIRLVSGTLYIHVQSSIVRTELMMRRIELCQALNSRSRVPIVRNVIVK